MAICPNCKRDTKELYFDVTATCSSWIDEDSFDKDKGCIEAYDLDALIGNVEFNNFSCNQCGEVIFDTEEEAKKFLIS